MIAPRAEVLAAVLAEHGDPRLPERFWAKVSVATSGCWLWTATTSGGYGRYSHGGRRWAAHRVTYVTFVGPIAEGLCLDHLCRNRACVNPAHLEPVTNRENVLRGVGLPAQHARNTHCPQGHPYDDENTRVAAKGYRVCRTCHRERERRAYRETPKPTCPDCGVPQSKLRQHRRLVHAIGEAS